jgi:hypothetical protein
MSWRNGRLAKAKKNHNCRDEGNDAKVSPIAVADHERRGWAQWSFFRSQTVAVALSKVPGTHHALGGATGLGASDYKLKSFLALPFPRYNVFTMGAFIESRNHTVQCLLRAPGSPIATLLLTPGSILFGEADSADPNGGVTYIPKRFTLVMV